MAFVYITHGSGTEADPYLIEDVNCLKEYLSSTNADTQNKYFKQTDDITVNDLNNFDNWKTIPPEYSTPKKEEGGFYDGDNHTIYGLYKKTTSDSYSSAEAQPYSTPSYRRVCGVFLNSAQTIKNLKISKSLLHGTDYYTSGNSNILSFCGICGYLKTNGLLDNCISETDIFIDTSRNNSSYPFQLAICGCAVDMGNSIFSNLTSNNNIFIKNLNYNKEIIYGGIAVSFAIYSSLYGRNYKTSLIKKCRNQSNINFDENSYITSNFLFGGIVYWIDSSMYHEKIEECYNASNLNIPKFLYTSSASFYPNFKISGILLAKGNSGEVKNCYNVGNFNIKNSNVAYNCVLWFSGISLYEAPASNYVILYGPESSLCYNFGTIVSDINIASIFSIGGQKNNGKSYTVAVENDSDNSPNTSIITEQEFGLVSSFPNFDFVDTWVMKAGRPRLQNNLEPSRFKLISIPNNTNRGAATGSGTYDEDTEVTITATAFAGFDFKGWSDGNKLPSRVIKMTNDLVMKAMFVEEGFGFNLLDFDGLTYFWNKIKSWFSSNEAGKGASTIGIADSAGIITATNVEGALAETKAIADTNASDVDYIKNNFVKRSPLEYPDTLKIVNGSTNYTPISQSSNYNPNKQYAIFTSSVYVDANFISISASELDNWDNTMKYYDVNTVTGDYVLYNVSDEQDFQDNKNHLYYVFETINQLSFDALLSANRLFEKLPSSDSKDYWNSEELFVGGMPHTAIIQVNAGYCNDIWITDNTIGQEVLQSAGRDSRGVGDLTWTFMARKGHAYRIYVHKYRESHGGSNRWSYIIINFFGD